MKDIDGLGIGIIIGLLYGLGGMFALMGGYFPIATAIMFVTAFIIHNGELKIRKKK